MVQPGEVLLGTYRVERLLGRGGMGEVVSALHLRLGERVALKVLTAERAAESQPRARMLREARAAAQLRGEHVARVFDLATLPDGSPVLVMDLIEGPTLSGLLAARGPLPIDEAVDLILQACEGLAEAHALGIVHRDLKPSNLMLSRRPDGSPLLKVVDFGLSREESSERLTRSDLTLGSPPYMSPEQIRTPHEADERTDVWSLGVTLYELLTGALPWAGYTNSGILASVVADEPIPPRDRRPELPEALQDAILGALTKPLAQRTRDVAALALALAPLHPEGEARARRVAQIRREPPRAVAPLPTAVFASDPDPTEEPAANLPARPDPAPTTSGERAALSSAPALSPSLPPPPRARPGWPWAALALLLVSLLAGWARWHSSPAEPATAPSAAVAAPPSGPPATPSAEPTAAPPALTTSAKSAAIQGVPSAASAPSAAPTATSTVPATTSATGAAAPEKPPGSAAPRASAQSRPTDRLDALGPRKLSCQRGHRRPGLWGRCGSLVRSCSDPERGSTGWPQSCVYTPA